MKFERNSDGTIKLTAAVFRAAYPEIYDQIELQGFNRGLGQGAARAQLHTAQSAPVHSQVQPQVGKPEQQSAPTMTREQRIIQEWKRSKSLQAEFAGDFKSYLAFTEAAEAGLVKICGIRA